MLIQFNFSPENHTSLHRYKEKPFLTEKSLETKLISVENESLVETFINPLGRKSVICQVYRHSQRENSEVDHCIYSANYYAGGIALLSFIAVKVKGLIFCTICSGAEEA